MKKRLCLFILLLSVIFANLSYAHEEELDFELDYQSYPITQLQAVGYGSLAFVVITAIIFFSGSKMSEMAKKITYALLMIVVVMVTLYLVITTVHTNIASATKGPVHWHADFEIWACDKRIELLEPKGLSNTQGIDLTHAHNDDRIHVEGVILDYKQASLGAFFNAIGGSISDDGFKVPANEGLASYHEGDFCNGQPARLHVFINGNKVGDPANHVIAQYEKVPPGDRIKIIFTEKQIENINPNIG